jgi:hypothetical protein
MSQDEDNVVGQQGPSSVVRATHAISDSEEESESASGTSIFAGMGSNLVWLTLSLFQLVEACPLTSLIGYSRLWNKRTGWGHPMGRPAR